MYTEKMPSIKEAQSKVLDDLKSSIHAIEQISEPKWSGLFNMDSKIPNGKGPGSKSIGCYMIFHKSDLIQPMSIGTGVIVNRISRHRAVFKNNGMVIVHTGGTSSDSRTAPKMYAFDPELSNWYWRFVIIGNSHLASHYEVVLQNHYQPLFNNLSMAGK